MRMRENSIPDQSLLRKVETAFAEFRANGGNRANYGAHLRALTISAVKGGHSASTVAKVAGVSEPSICNWLRSRPKLSPVAEELTIVPDVTATMTNGNMARVHLVSGVVIELPLSGLTLTMIAMFASQGGSI